MSVKGYCVYDKQNNTWLLVDMKFLFSCSTRVKHKEKFHIYVRPCIILYLYIIARWNNNIARWMGNLLGRTWPAVTHVVSADETTMAATVEEVGYEVNSLFYFREKIIEQFFSILVRNSFVNQYSKAWFCEILRDSYRDGCQCLRTSVDYLIFLITLQVCKFLDGTSASLTALR